MTTTEFIKFIKDCQEDRKKSFIAGWSFTEPVYLISESELKKIERINIELLQALKELIECDYTSGTHLSCAITKGKQVIKNASEINKFVFN